MYNNNGVCSGSQPRRFKLIGVFAVCCIRKCAQFYYSDSEENQPNGILKINCKCRKAQYIFVFEICFDISLI